MTVRIGEAFPGHVPPGAGFEVPLEMMAACHLRVADQCATLDRLAVHLGQHGADPQAHSAALAVMRYFDTAARHHHDDEELDLFPALIESMAGSDAVCIRALVDGLLADHRELERRWAALRPALQRIAQGSAALLAADAVRAFIELYERHIAREEAELLPMAARLLDDATLDRIGLAMRTRRGVAGAVPPAASGA